MQISGWVQGISIYSQIFVIVNRVWKDFCMIWGLAVIWENKIHSAVICEFYLSCDVGFALSVVLDL